MKRENLNANLAAIKLKINELSKKRFKYFIHGKYIPGYGTIQLLEDPTQLVKAFGFVKSQFSNDDDLSSIESELGFTIGKEVEEETQTYFGFELSEWTEEFKMRASEIQNVLAIEELKTALKTFKGYRTEDEKFESDAKKFSTLFSELGLVEKNESEVNSPHNTVINVTG